MPWNTTVTFTSSWAALNCLARRSTASRLAANSECQIVTLTGPLGTPVGLASSPPPPQPGSPIADPFAPLMTEPVLRDRLRLIRYHRRGFAGSSRPDGPLPISRQAADFPALPRSLRLPRAHGV